MITDPDSATRLFGLIGYPLSHSFSKKYFSKKYQDEGIEDAYYELFPIEEVKQLPTLIDRYPNLIGLNVTIPYKEQVIPYMDRLGAGAKAINAVNTIKVTKNGLEGHNSDIFGFGRSLANFIEASGGDLSDLKGLVLGTGGAAKAVAYVLGQLSMPFKIVSRSPGKADLTYDQVGQTELDTYRLIINTTPLGMAPNLDTCPNLPYRFLNSNHFLFDLVYNPKETLFLTRGKERGARTKNGLEMLYLQAEKSWEIWNS